MTAPLVSIIIPAYQAEGLIERVIRNALAQTYRPIEVWVMDDGSTDRTALLAKSFQREVEGEVLRVISQSNQGVAKTRNDAVALSQGQYLAFLDADDLWHPQYLEKSLVVFQQYPDAALVYSSYYAVDEQERLMNVAPIPVYKGLCFEAVLNTEGFLLPSIIVMTRQAFDLLGGFPLDSHHEDRVFFIRLSQAHAIYPTAERLVLYRQSQSGRCRSVLKNFDAAVSAEVSIVDSLASVLTPQQSQHLHAVQVRNLFYRLLMYDYMPAAKQLYQHVDPLLCTGKKGVLAQLSMMTGFNWLSSSRKLYQWVSGLLLMGWWQRVRQPFYF